MRFFKYKDFLKLPNGTVYAHYENGSCGNFGGWEIKRGAARDDEFLYSPLVAIKSKDDVDFRAKVEAGLLGGHVEASFYSYNKDENYDESRMFVVLSKEEVQKLISALVNIL